jgi:putative Holliday junction resolvase
VEFQQNTENGRILALDLGKKRIGLALSDPLGISAQGLHTLRRTTIREDIAALEALAREHDVKLVLVGHPLNMSGAEGRQAVYTRDFAERLRERTGLTVRFWDERLTSKEAERVLKQSGIGIEKRARAIDRLAAVILLASFLDSRAHMGDGAADMAGDAA